MVSPTLPFPEVGQMVLVHWGLEEIKAQVIEVYGDGPLARVRVEVPIYGTHGEALDKAEISLPLDAIRAV